MAIFYVDYQGGVDTNDGLSFATRKQSLSSAFAVPALTAGDEIRIKKTPDPKYIGDSLWVPNSAVSVVLPPGTTQNIYLDGAWVAGTNVVATTNTTRKQGVNSASLAPNASFTTGKIGHFATANLNLSAYSKLAFWFFSTVGITGNVLSGVSLSLCSDAAGNVPVYTLNFPTAPMVLNSWGAITLDNGSPFTSATSISSISLSATTPGLLSRVLLVDNIIATNDVTFETAIGTNSSTSYDWSDLKPWYGIRSIVDNQVILDYGINSNLLINDSNYGFYGTTSATLSTYILSCVAIPTPLNYIVTTNSYGNILPKSGAVNNPITITGGWDETDMSTRTGVSWLKPAIGCSQGTLIQAGTTSYWKIENIGTFGFSVVFGQPNNTNITLSGVTLNNFHTYGCRQHILFQNTFSFNSAHQFLINECVATNLGAANTDHGCFLYSNTNQGMDYLSATNIFVSNTVGTFFYLPNGSNFCYMNNISCLNATPATNNTGRGHVFLNGVVGSLNNLTLRNGFYIGLWLNRCINCNVNNARIDNFSQYGVINSTDNASGFLSFPFDNYFSDLYISRCGSSVGGTQDFCGFGTFGGNTYLYNTRIEFCSGGGVGGGAVNLGNAGGVTYFYGLSTVGNRSFGSVSRAITTSRVAYSVGAPVCYVHNWKYSETSPAGINLDYYNQKIVSVNDNDSGNTVVTSDGGTITTDTTIVRPGGSSKSWKMSLLSTTRRPSYPLYQKIENIYVTANKTYTASIYMYRTSNDVEGGLNLTIPMLRGVAPQSVITTAASLSAWEKLSLTFTPTQDGFVWFKIDAWLNTSSLTQSVYWTDFDITPRVSTNITAGNYSVPSSEGAYVASTSFETSHPFC
jgi:hypothetical protein